MNKSLNIEGLLKVAVEVAENDQNIMVTWMKTKLCVHDPYSDFYFSVVNDHEQGVWEPLFSKKKYAWLPPVSVIPIFYW